MRFGLTTDFRNPAGSGKTSATLYAETIELFTWAETLGFSQRGLAPVRVDLISAPTEVAQLNTPAALPASR